MCAFYSSFRLCEGSFKSRIASRENIHNQPINKTLSSLWTYLETETHYVRSQHEPRAPPLQLGTFPALSVSRTGGLSTRGTAAAISY